MNVLYFFVIMTVFKAVQQDWPVSGVMLLANQRLMYVNIILFFPILQQFVLLLGGLQSKYSPVINMRLHAKSHQARLRSAMHLRSVHV